MCFIYCCLFIILYIVCFNCCLFGKHAGSYYYYYSWENVYLFFTQFFLCNLLSFLSRRMLFDKKKRCDPTKDPLEQSKYSCVYVVDNSFNDYFCLFKFILPSKIINSYCLLLLLSILVVLYKNILYRFFYVLFSAIQWNKRRCSLLSLFLVSVVNNSYHSLYPAH